MLAIRKLNNNAVVCRDSLNREVVALGKGIGFGGDFPRELDMAAIERTFYSVDTKGQRIMQDLPRTCLSLRQGSWTLLPMSFPMS